MAISFHAAGTAAIGTTSLAVPYPTVTAGDLLVLFVANKYPTNAPGTPTDFSAPSGNQYSGGAGAAGADTGTVYITVFVKIATGSETGNATVTLTGANTSIGRMFSYTNTGSWGYACAGGSDNSAGTSWSVTAGANPGVTAADMVLVGSAICGNTDTATSEVITQTGVTFGTMVERQDSGSNTGDDISLVVSEHPVSSGTGSAAPVYTMTISGTGSATAAGASLIIRLRQVAAIVGDANITLGALTTTSAGAADIAASASPTLGAVTLTAAGTVDVQGASSVTLGVMTMASDGVVDVQGSANITLGVLTVTGEGTVGSPELTADADITLGALAVTSAGTVDVAGAGSITLGAIISAGAGAVDVQGSASLTLGALTTSAAGAGDIVASLSGTLDALTVTASGGGEFAERTADANITLGIVTTTSTGAADIAGTSAITLGALTGSGAGTVNVTGNTGITLGVLTTSASGTSGVEELFSLPVILRAAAPDLRHIPGRARPPGVAIRPPAPPRRRRL
jgi:hypothetical protein